MCIWVVYILIGVWVLGTPNADMWYLLTTQTHFPFKKYSKIHFVIEFVVLHSKINYSLIQQQILTFLSGYAVPCAAFQFINAIKKMQLKFTVIF